jgi:hypothetical protein
MKRRSTAEFRLQQPLLQLGVDIRLPGIRPEQHTQDCQQEKY